MTNFRTIAVAVALGAASLLTACTSAPTMPMGTAAAAGMANPDQMARMDAQMKTMRDMQEKMMAAKTPEERNAMMAAHMTAMKDGMAMMKGMQGMQGGTASPQQMMMMEKRMEMMQTMMEMMMGRMPAAAGK